MSPAPIVLSSRQTYVMKVIFPIVWIGGFGAGTAVMWAGNGAPDQMKWTFLAALIAGSLSTWWICVPLKKVSVDGGMLYVSNYLKEIALPLDIIERVSENRWINIRPVTLYFRRSTDFGNKIVFMPKTRIMWPWSSHPVVDEIRRMVMVATGEGGKERNSE
jgi:hypothetical protein